MLGLGIASVEEGFFYAVGKSGVSKACAELAREGRSYSCSRVPASKTVSLGREECEEWEEHGQSRKELA